MERELAEFKETTEKAVNAREKTVSEREEQIEILENKVKTLETERDQAVEEAVNKTTDKFEAEFKSCESLMKMEVEG